MAAVPVQAEARITNSLSEILMLIDPRHVAPRYIPSDGLAHHAAADRVGVHAFAARHFKPAPFSFFNGVGANPDTAFLSVNNRHGQKKDTLRNIEATQEFVVNVVPFALAKPMNDTSEDLPMKSVSSKSRHCNGTVNARQPPRVKDRRSI